MTKISGETNLEFDYVIVGAGSAGCLLANRLSARHKVLLIEAGGTDDWRWIHIPVGYLYCIGNPKTDWCYRTKSDPGLHGRTLGYPRGRVLGGSSSINGMLYLRGQAADYNHWESLGNDGWGWDDVLPLFMAVEDHYAGASEYHGGSGTWRVEKQRLRWQVLEDFRMAAKQAGIPHTEDFNRGDNYGCNYFEVNQRKGIRWNAAKAFLHPISSRANLKIITQAQVTKINFINKRATGISFMQNGEIITAKAHKEVILSAGAIGSPLLLQLSGVGSAEYLHNLGIDVVHDLPGVGGNLQDHLQLRTIFKLENAKTLNTIANSLWGKAMMGLQYALNRSGPLSMAPSQLGAFAYSDDKQTRPNLEFHVQPLSLDRFGDPLHEFPAMTASICNLRPSSRGHVLIKSPNFQEQPEILCNYLQTYEDKKVAVDAIKLARKIMQQPAMAPYKPEEYLPGLACQTDEELSDAAGDIGTTIFHPVGTCKMGVDSQAVVDPQLRVHGLESIRVIDASIMPYITSGNTNSPTIMIAEKGARMIADSAL